MLEKCQKSWKVQGIAIRNFTICYVLMNVTNDINMMKIKFYSATFPKGDFEIECPIRNTLRQNSFLQLDHNLSADNGTHSISDVQFFHVPCLFRAWTIMAPYNILFFVMFVFLLSPFLFYHPFAQTS